MKKPKLEHISFTPNGYDQAQLILQTLGTKTKLQFIQALITEFEKTKSEAHQMLNSGDVMRVAADNEISYDVAEVNSFTK